MRGRRGQRRVAGHGLVAGENAAAEEGVVRGVDRELKVAVQEPVADARLEAVHEVRRVAERHNAADLDPRPEPQRHAGDDAEEPIAADRQPEQLAVASARAADQVAVRVHQIEGLHLLHDRFQRQAAAVDVRRQRAPEREPVGAGLFLVDSPRAGAPRLRTLQELEERRPLDATFDRDESRARVERDHAVERARVDERRAGAELLSAHRVPPAGDRQRPARHPGAGHDHAEFLEVPRRDHGGDLCGVERGVEVVDERRHGSGLTRP